ncbi:Glu/Leu/Phe/Val dehydrogenase dimerization domain-containing protein [Phaeobacter gallaeciensis]|uniref:Glu/Leu/Phe/Val family dehydrogenase n=1 Tax=Phaeobacter TaxID=302485 RepID=UPI0023807118|nr:Glu/Leu/Phe/Val dehydrogenase dimerization domain-containing protein [Phaeobacter gallaeciensis]MDE4275642.1 Glu/Leu/Phe/Val dehydrogenase dimerization domain-containing protein [Phaeobacter gallaeciensis]MDE4300607.1 Glu/Leu/Phe/Val dehydrogenase dimerization domain-containing protein [Phaeobacter gallaeciensis]MDE5185771.1 Glu/Leu/Phe/Val dehydrogenase dimerization domain-containing protein [Phaeobacter gallaeciensis]
MTLTKIASPGHEEIYRVDDPAVGLTGFIAIHSTEAGPAAGGLRMRAYATADEALEDVRRLSEGMTYKNAAAGLPLGGGKAVIIGDPTTSKTPEMLRAFGRAIDSLNGRYITAEDMGMSPADMALLADETPYVAGLANGEFASGDPSPITARGIFNAIRTARAHKAGSADLQGVTVAVQGLGHVGWYLCQFLNDAGAGLIVTDVDPQRIERAVAEFGARPVAINKICTVQADIFAPCAIGGILNAETIPLLQVGIVAGGANNQLATPEDGQALHKRGILYAPDFIANGGGIINVATEILKIADRESYVAEKLTALDATMAEVLNQARQKDISPDAVAIATVRAKMAQAAAA